MLSLLILVMGGGFQFLIAWVRQTYIDSDDVGQQIVYSSLTAMIISIFNLLIVLVFYVITNHEKYDNKSQLKVGLTIRIVLFQFLNTGIFVVVVNVISEIIIKGSFNYRNSFITYDITQIIILNAVVTNILNLLMNRLEVSKLFFRHLIKK